MSVSLPLVNMSASMQMELFAVGAWKDLSLRMAQHVVVSYIISRDFSYISKPPILSMYDW